MKNLLTFSILILFAKMSFGQLGDSLSNENYLKQLYGYKHYKAIFMKPQYKKLQRDNTSFVIADSLNFELDSIVFEYLFGITI